MGQSQQTYNDTCSDEYKYYSEDSYIDGDDSVLPKYQPAASIDNLRQIKKAIVVSANHLSQKDYLMLIIAARFGINADVRDRIRGDLMRMYAAHDILAEYLLMNNFTTNKRVWVANIVSRHQSWEAALVIYKCSGSQRRMLERICGLYKYLRLIYTGTTAIVYHQDNKCMVV